MMNGKSKNVSQDLRRRIACNVAALRGERGLTYEALAQQTDLHWRQLQKIEAGDSNITLVTLARLANGLGVTLEELLAK